MLDNGSSTRAANGRLVHDPCMRCWLAPIEIVFSVIQPIVVQPADFADLAALADHLAAVRERDHETARPSTGAALDGHCTGDDLAVMLDRLEGRRPRAELPLAA